MGWLDAIFEALRAAFRKDYRTKITYSSMPPEAPKLPSEPTLTVPSPSMLDELFSDWSDPKHAYHDVRVLADRAGLTLLQKNILCACIYQESTFKNSAINHNKNSEGVTTSTDWGLCQINDWFHIGPKKDFPSVQYVLDNPDKAVEYMINCQKHGLLRLWSSYTSGAYQKWLLPSSPMWKLKT